MDDPSSPLILWRPGFRAVAIGWALHMQGRGWLESGWYREMAAPLDSCWMLNATIAENGQTFAIILRPRGARPFNVDDVHKLDRLRPLLAHALRRTSSGDARWEDPDPTGAAGAPVLSGQMILTPCARLVFQTSGLEFLLIVLKGETADYTRYVPVRDRLPRQS